MKMNLCPTCKCSYELNLDIISKFDMDHPNGEKLELAISICPHCESLHLPVDLNVVSFKIEIAEDKIIRI